MAQLDVIEQTKSDVALGVIGALLGAGDLSTETLERTFVVAFQK